VGAGERGRSLGEGWREGAAHLDRLELVRLPLLHLRGGRHAHLQLPRRRAHRPHEPLQRLAAPGRVHLLATRVALAARRCGDKAVLEKAVVEPPCGEQPIVREERHVRDRPDVPSARYARLGVVLRSRIAEKADGAVGLASGDQRLNVGPGA
jgi:hypothetical protein